MPEAAPPSVLEFRGLAFSGEEGEALGPLDLSLFPGKKALLLHPDVFVLQKIIRLAIGWAAPLRGAAFFKGSPVRGGGRLLDPRALGTEISVVYRESELLLGRTVFENIMAHFLYNIPGPMGELRERAAGHIVAAGLKERTFLSPVRSLSERERRLGLYALALAKEPDLFILERPMQFLDRDFPRVWGLVSQAAGGKSAVLVLGREREGYDKSGFDHALSL